VWRGGRGEGEVECGDIGCYVRHFGAYAGRRGFELPASWMGTVILLLRPFVLDLLVFGGTEKDSCCGLL
jgi:hypothetical protein